MTEQTTDKIMNEAPSAAGASRRRMLIWASVVLAVAAWCALMWVDGWTALVVAVMSAAAGLAGCRKETSTAMRRLATAAVIAALVLVVVDTAFLVALRISLGI